LTDWLRTIQKWYARYGVGYSRAGFKPYYTLFGKNAGALAQIFCSVDK